MISSTVMRFQMHVASTSMRFAAPSRPTICAPSSRPVPRSVTSFTRIGAGVRVVRRAAACRRSTVANASKPGVARLRARSSPVRATS